MKIFHGRIVAADKGEGTVTIQPDNGVVNGVVIGEEVNIIPVESDFDRYVKSKDYRQDKMLNREPGE